MPPLSNRSRRSQSSLGKAMKKLMKITTNLALGRQNQAESSDDVGKRIIQNKPPTFDGYGEPKVLESWLREFDKIFSVVRCPENLKVDQAAFYLREGADFWWSQNRNSLIQRAEGEGTEFSWELFKEALREKYYPPYLRKQKAIEFSQLKMGEMSVEEYYRKFTELIWFSPELVPTETSKIQKFELGLSYELQKLLGGEQFTSLETILSRATHLSGIIKREKEAEKEVGEKRRDSQPQQF